LNSGAEVWLSTTFLGGGAAGARAEGVLGVADQGACAIGIATARNPRPLREGVCQARANAPLTAGPAEHEKALKYECSTQMRSK
jgi:hypothetical protein